MTGQGGPDARYRYDGVVLDFAPAVLATARSMSSGGGVPRRMIEVKTGAHVNPRHTEAQVLRWARCRVPDVPGVEDMVTERLGYAEDQPVGVRESDVSRRAAHDLREWEGVPVKDRTFAALVHPPGKTITCVPETVCVKRCSSCPPENCVVKGWDCTGVDSGIGGNGTGYDDGGYHTGPIPTITPDDPEIEVTPTGPPGVPQEFFQSLNPREKELCWASPLECAQVALSKSEAEDFAEDAGYYSGVPGPHNGPQDALRHAMWSAEMAQRIGANQAEVWGTAHEMDFNLEPPAPNMSNPETVMDLYNNQVGRNIGVNTSGDLRQAILDALDNGLLQEWVCPEIGSVNPANYRS
jgi:hypothetical protein